MGRNARKEAITKLREQIAVCPPDKPKLLVQLTRQLNKLFALKPETAKAGSDPKSTYVPNGSAMDQLPLGEQTCHRLVLAVEAEVRRRKSSGLPELMGDERIAFMQETLKTYSEEERAAFVAYGQKDQEPVS